MAHTERTKLAMARKCPKCNTIGELVKEAPTTDPRLTGYVFRCTRNLCSWYDTTWVVTADEFGDVVTRDPHAPKKWPELPKISDATRKRIRETFDDVDQE
jgi:hypothetical protein